MKKLLIVLLILNNFVLVADNWTQVANFGAGNRFGAANFSIGTKGYICAGSNNSGFFNDLWEYDPSTDVWTQKASMPLGGRESPVGFSIGTNGYVGMGYGMASLFYSDFYKWNQTTNTWTQIANYPGEGGIGLSACVGFSITGKGYVGTGGGWATSSFASSSEFYEYDTLTDIWTQKANFAGGMRWFAVGFSIGNKGYIGTGDSSSVSSDVLKKDFWEYDPSSDIWTQKANLGGGVRGYAVGFSIGTKGYIGTGGSGNSGVNYTDFWQWNQATNVWTQKANYLGCSSGGIYTGSGFSIGTKGYLGLGGGPTTAAQQDFWVYSPDSTTSVNEISDAKFEINIYPNPISDKLNVQINNYEQTEIILYDLSSRELLQQTFTNTTTINTEQLATGMYLYTVRNRNGIIKNGKVIKQ